MVTCLAHGATSLAHGHDACSVIDASEIGNPVIAMPLAIAASADLNGGRSAEPLQSVSPSIVPRRLPRSRLQWGEAALVAGAALCLVLVPSVQSLGLSVDNAGTGAPIAAAAEPRQLHADWVVAEEVASVIAAG